MTMASTLVGFDLGISPSFVHHWNKNTFHYQQNYVNHVLHNRESQYIQPSQNGVPKSEIHHRLSTEKSGQRLTMQ